MVALGLAGCSGRSPPPTPRSYAEAEVKRPDLQPVSDRARAALEAEAGRPGGVITNVISLDQASYSPQDPIYLTVLWLNDSDRPVRICRRLFLGANFDVLILLNDNARVLANVQPEKPGTELREGDFVVLPPYGEHAEVIDLKNLPRFGLASGQNEAWRFDLSRPGSYLIRFTGRSVPVQLVPENLRGDPTATLWEGSTLSNLASFKVRRR